ncbi:MAG: AI-2E family transporter [Bacteroidota bacterium]
MKDTFSVQKLASLLIIVCILVYFLVIAKNVLMPFLFAGLFAFLLKPLCSKIEQFIPLPGVAVGLSIMALIVPIILVMALFSVQIATVFEDLPAIGNRLETGMNEAFQWINRQIGLGGISSRDWMEDNASKMMDGPLSLIGKSLSFSSIFAANFFLFFLYTFFLLLYRSSIKQFLLIQVSETERPKREALFVKIQGVVQKYLSGMGIVMLVLGGLNSLGLYLIGLQYALLWGFLAAFLAIIPYIGTLVGGLLPFLYAMATSDSLTQPILVILLFGIIQGLEGNIITPKIVGSSVKINPLAAIISLIIGAALWGVAGIILALPSIAVLRIVMGEIDVLKPFSVLLSSDIYEKEKVFENKFDKERFRFKNFFKRKETV